MKCFMLIIVILAILSMSSAQDAGATVVVKHDDVQEVTESSNTAKVNPSHNSAPFGHKSKFQQPSHWYGNSHGQQFGGRTH
ncbi:unnamed protein product [Diamesa tonsa]